MGNPYFQFKQFTVWHDLCAMKVGIDGVLLGAWADVHGCRQLLDVGTGSGLIALMLAQRAPQARIDAIDIEESAVRQARLNVSASPWNDRIRVWHRSLQDFTPRDKAATYDLIVSNPPYFVHSTHTPVRERTQARHADSLPHEELLAHAARLLAPQGRLCLILPVAEGERCIALAAHENLHCTRRTDVHPKPATPAKRLLLELSRTPAPTTRTALTIEDGTRHQYTPEFTALAKDFYLKL